MDEFKNENFEENENVENVENEETEEVQEVVAETESTVEDDVEIELFTTEEFITEEDDDCVVEFYEEQSTNFDELNEKPKKKSLKKALIAAGLVVCIAAGVAGGYTLGKTNFSSEKKGTWLVQFGSIKMTLKQKDLILFTDINNNTIIITTKSILILKKHKGEKVMRKNYVYAITLILLSIFLWLGYYLYLESKPVVYKNGTFVELPANDRNGKDILEFSA